MKLAATAQHRDQLKQWRIIGHVAQLGKRLDIVFNHESDATCRLAAGDECFRQQQRYVQREPAHRLRGAILPIKQPVK